MADPRTAARAIGVGLRLLHDRLPLDDCPFGPPPWVTDSPPIDRLVVCHGDACAPNTLIDDDGRFCGHVDLGDLGVADRWADLAVATLSLSWNYSGSWEGELFDAYGVGSGPGSHRLLPAAVERGRHLVPLSSNRIVHRAGRVLVQVTSVGHAGFRIDTKAGSILCDPWVNPAYFASWFPFPDNSTLDWDALGDVDYLYVSHLHRDHFDPKTLREHVNKDAVVLLPDYPVPDLQRELEKLGFHRFFETTDSVKHRVSGPKGDLDVMIIALRAPADGPIGDSGLVVDDGETVAST